MFSQNHVLGDLNSFEYTEEDFESIPDKTQYYNNENKRFFEDIDKINKNESKNYVRDNSNVKINESKNNQELEDDMQFVKEIILYLNKYIKYIYDNKKIIKMITEMFLVIIISSFFFYLGTLQ